MIIITKKWLDEKHQFSLPALEHCHPMVITFSLKLCGWYFICLLFMLTYRYQRVTTSFEKVLTGIPKALANPKSPNLSSPLRLIRRF